MTSGEFFESLTGLTLQMKSCVFDAVDLRVGLLASFLSSTKSAMGIDFFDRKYFIITMNVGTGDSSVDRDIDMATCLLHELMVDLRRSILLV